MGSQLSGIAPSQMLPVESYLSDINSKYPDIVFESSLGNTRFLKVIKAVTEGGPIVIKIFVIHDSALSVINHKKQLDYVFCKLQDAPNCLPFHFSEVSERAGFMIRHYMKSSLYDRISTRPFLTSIEKKWIAFQILSALQQAHDKNVCHGDLKLENILITPWSWVMITDFATYKPILLPEDNPANYTYFFDTSAKRVCYIAPERFRQTCHRAEEQLLVLKDLKDTDSHSPTMDIFSAGCVLTELFTEGSVPFDFPQLLRFRTDNYFPTKVLDEIQDERIKALIEHMISKDPSTRLSAEEYLKQERGLAFPESFYFIFFDFVKQFSSPVSLSSDARIKRVHSSLPDILNALFQLECSQNMTNENIPVDKRVSKKSELLIIIVSLITSSIRSLEHLSSKLLTLQLLRTLSPYCFDEVILDRILPFILYLLQSDEDDVRVEAISTLSYCLSLVSNVPRTEVNIFREYIFPNINDVVHDHSVKVRSSFAMHIGTIADIASRFLQFVYLKAMVSNYDEEMSGLHKVIQQKVATLFSDPSNEVKSTLIEYSAVNLCIFFGSQKANDVILSHMITFLNEKKCPSLRRAFFKNIVGVATSIGSQSAAILQPLLLQGLSDTEESVIISSIDAMAALAGIGFFSRPLLFNLLTDTVPLLVHPNEWIRQAVVDLFVKVSKILPFVVVLTIIKNICGPYLMLDNLQFDKEHAFLSSLNPVIPREVYDTLIKSSNVENLIKILHDPALKQASLKNIANIHLDAADSQIRNLLRRLYGGGLVEHNLKYIFALQDHLIRVQRHKKTADSSYGTQQPTHETVAFISRIEEVSLLSSDVRLSGGDSLEMPSLASSTHGSVTSPTQAMNEEWQTMFGNSEVPATVSATFSDRSQSPLKADSSSDSCPSSKTEETLASGSIVECKNDFESVVATKRREYMQALKQHKAFMSSALDETLFPARWKPKGNWIAHLHEHKGAIHRMVNLKAKPSFFASCSSDGTLKIWDCNKTERKFPIFKSKFTYSKQSGVITSLASSFDGNLLASGSRNGSIHILRVDKQCTLTSRQLDKEKEGNPVDLSFMDSGSESVLTYATTYGEIVGWDIRSPSIAWRLNNDVKKGLITSYVIDKSQMWLAIGTSRGYHTCWDLRFQLQISQLQHSRESSVRRLKIHPRQPSCIVSALTENNEVAFFDLETNSRLRTLWASSEQPLNPQSSKCSLSISGLALGQTQSGETFVITGGHDCILRFWNMEQPHESFHIADSAHRYTAPKVDYALKVVDESEVIIENTQKAPHDADETPCRGAVPPPTGHKDSITDVLLISSPQKLIVSSSYDGVIKIWK